MAANLKFQGACETGQIENVKVMLLNKNINPAANDQLALRLACKNDHTVVVNVLLDIDHMTPMTPVNNDCIASASANGHTDTIQLLLNDYRVDPSVDKNKAIRMAALGGH